MRVIAQAPDSASIALLEELYTSPALPASQVGLQRVERMLSELGNPHSSFRSVHISGSSGKGSTTTMIGSILQSAGFKTGYFRSPHLTSYRERIAINGVDVSVHDWEAHFRRMWPLVEAMRNGTLPDYDLGRPALFEVLFAIMALHFSAEGVEWAAIETGLGGRLDATNVLAADVAAITNVSLEHTQILGKTVAEIAQEKAAIIKAGSSAVTAVDDVSALDVIARRCALVGVPLLRVGHDIGVEVISESSRGQSLQMSKNGIPDVKVRLSLAGKFQATNAATAFASIEALRSRGISIPDPAISEGLLTAALPGRIEVVSDSPLVVLDGAHNPASARELSLAISQLWGRRRLVLVFGCMADKDFATMACYLGPLASEVFVTRVPGTDRSAAVEKVAATFNRHVHHVVVDDNVDKILDRALESIDPDTMLLVTGSIYLVGYARERFLESAELK